MGESKYPRDGLHSLSALGPSACPSLSLSPACRQCLLATCLKSLLSSLIGRNMEGVITRPEEESKSKDRRRRTSNEKVLIFCRVWHGEAQTLTSQEVALVLPVTSEVLLHRKSYYYEGLGSNGTNHLIACGVVWVAHRLLIRATCDTWASACACCMFSSQSRILYSSKGFILGNKLVLSFGKDTVNWSKVTVKSIIMFK